MEMSCPIKQFSPEHLESVTKCYVKDHCAESDLCLYAVSGHQQQTMREGGERRSLAKCQSLQQVVGIFYNLPDRFFRHRRRSVML